MNFHLSFSNLTENIKIVWNGLEQSISLKNINSILYISINDISRLFNSQSKIIDCSFIYKNEEIKFSRGSFFTIYKKNDNLRIAQMSLPVIQNNDIVLIPFSSFLYSLSGIGILEYFITNGKYYINTDIFNFHEEKLINIEKTVKDNKQKSEITQKIKIDSLQNKLYDNINININIDTMRKPLKYYIPLNINK